MNKPQRGQVGVNPTSYNFDKFKVFDQSGLEITNSITEVYKTKIQEIYQKLPSFTSYGKDMIDSWVDETSEDIDAHQREKYLKSMHDFIAVIQVENGFFEGHKLIIKKVEFKGTALSIDYVAIDLDNKPLENQDAMSFIAENVVLLLIYEDALKDEIETERMNRIG